VKLTEVFVYEPKQEVKAREIQWNPEEPKALLPGFKYQSFNFIAKFIQNS